MTCGNTISHHRNLPVITGHVLLLICGFGVQVPDGAPPSDLALCSWWALCATHGEAQRGQMRTRSGHGLHASVHQREICWCQAKRAPATTPPLLLTGRAAVQ